MSIISNEHRIGNFTSSEIWKLTTTGKGVNGFGAPAITYIKEKNLERKLGRSIKTEAYSKPMAWGNLIETYVFEEKLGLEYQIQSKSTDIHPEIKFWSGSKDLIVTGKKIGEIKCYEPKHFAEYADALLSKDTEFLKKECPEEYWQMISNSIINQVPNAEAILYIPYKSELAKIREYASNYDCSDPWQYRFIAESEDDSLPYIPDNGYYLDLNRFEFEVPQEDKDFLTERVLLAGSMLINPVMLATHDEEVNATIVEQILKPSIID
jgi:hypothetical protein